MTYRETDPRALAVLERALHSVSTRTRVRAVALLARVDCDARMRWLTSAAADPRPAVSSTALCAIAWALEVVEAPWPAREDVGTPGPASASSDADGDDAPGVAGARWHWHYVIEVWREDGLLVGAYPAVTCCEDDEHAKRIALGQAIIESPGRQGDGFDPGAAAAFIVEKHRSSRVLRGPGPGNREGKRRSG